MFAALPTLMCLPNDDVLDPRFLPYAIVQVDGFLGKDATVFRPRLESPSVLV
jgi:hypothetical protein